VRLKRAIDIVLSALALLVGLPLLVAIAGAVAVDSGFPVLFRQRRAGLAFRQFPLLKFRSMDGRNCGLRITVAGDRRVTRVGRFLRATKLDELPQFWNVLCGDMSLVGPRPELPEYVEMYRSRYEHILSIRPGITDLASISFRDEEELLGRSSDPLREYALRVLPAKLDLADEYLERRSLRLDLHILAQTLAVILRTA
jgi:lipopolysaccharide/colanic/teichoic acid biosynthesis glycosyltransferase